MILHRDHVVIEGGLYRLCESAFVDVNVCVIRGQECLLYPRVVVKDAKGAIHGKSVGAKPFSPAALALAATGSLPINLDRQPAVWLDHERSGRKWSDRPDGERAIISLHAIYERARLRRGRRLTYLEFVLRILEHVSGIQVTFQMTSDRIDKMTIHFGQEGKSGFLADVFPDHENDIVTSSFVPLSETCET